MKYIIRKSFFLLIVITTGACTINKKLTSPEAIIAPVSDTVKLREGSIIYALPRTVFTVKAEFERVVEIPGPYAKYASDLLGLNEVILRKNEIWSLKGISVNSHEEADPSEYYVIEAAGSFRSNVLALKSEGLILDLNPAEDFHGRDMVNEKEVNVSRFVSYDLGSDEYYQVQTDTAFRRVRVDSSFIRIPYIVEKKKKLTTDQLAERAARRVMELRDGKILILTGEANVFPQSEAPINEINRMEKAYLQLFTGKIFRESRTYTCQVIPAREMTGSPVELFKFSEATGPADSDSNTGEPVILRIIPGQKTKDITVITREQPEPSAIRNDKLYYRIPDVANLEISLGGETLYTSRKLVSQFGEVMQMPANYVIGK
jgi:hypothetical protein